MKERKFLGRASKGRFCINGVDVFKYPWHSYGECAVVLEPDTKKPYAFSAYSVTSGSTEVRFFAGKFDDDEWAFYDFEE